MGMWDKDQLYGGLRLDKWADYDQEFILWEAHVSPIMVPTSVGNARKTFLTVSPMEAPDNKIEVGTLASAIAEKVSGETLDNKTGEVTKTSVGASADDFPAVVMVTKVESATWGTEATVLVFVREYKVAKPK